MSRVRYSDDTVTVYAGDCLDVLAELPAASVDAVVTDPPYALGFMGREWDRFGDTGRGARARTERAAEVTPTGEGHSTSAGPYLAAGVDSLRSAGLPFQRWCEAWATECLRILKPGGHLLAFGGTRTSHRLACAIEDAGFEIRDSIAWLYGSGFPKSLDVSKAIDKARDDRSDVLAVTTRLAELAEVAGISRADVDEHMGTSDMGGWWLSRLARRCACPSVDNWTRLREYIPGATELDAEVWRLNGRKGSPGEAWGQREVVGPHPSPATPRVGTFNASFGEATLTAPATDAARQWQGFGTALKPAHEPVVVARKPFTGTVAANVLTHGTGALNVDGCRVDRTEGDRTEYGRDRHLPHANTTASLGKFQEVTPYEPHNAGRWPANVVLDDFQQPSYGGVGGASRFFYTAKATSGERLTVNGTAHPTVKPLSLMRWLARLVTPPDGTVLDPFAGSGTTVEACILEHFRCIAIEREADYLPLITQRINRRRHPVAYVAASGEDGGLFDLLDGGDVA